MDHYLDLRIRPDPEFPPQQLLSALFSKLHRVLAEQQRTDVGVSFPGWKLKPQTLGDVLRLHATAAALESLVATAWLGGMQQMVQLSDVSAVPPDARHRRLLRVQAKSSPERLRRRLMRRKQLSPEEATAQIPDSAAERLSLPFVEISSRSTGQRFRLFLKQGPEQTRSVSGDFNAYGLSATATVPWF